MTRTEKFDTDAAGQRPGPVDDAGSLDPAGERNNNTTRAFVEMRRRILAAEMPPDTQYLEQELAEMLGMSRTPVREALIRLEEAGLVEVRPRHGARVLSVSAHDVREIYEILADLDAAAARAVAQRGLSDGERAALQSALSRLQRAQTAGDVAEWARAENDFHETIAKAANNRRLATLRKSLLNQTHRARMTALAKHGSPLRGHTDLASLVEAMNSRNADGAYTQAQQYRQRAGQVIVRELEKLPLPVKV